MSNQKFTNNASTTLGSAAGSSDTTMTVATGTGGEFPALSGGDYFVATLWAAGNTTGVPNEIVKVTARVGDTMTVVRGQEGTTAQAWSVGDTFALYPTALWYNSVAGADQIQAQTGNSAVDTGTANAGLVALSPTISSLATILYAPIRILKMASANTGAYTLNVNGLGVVAVKIGGQPLVAGQLPANTMFEVVWNGTNFDLISAQAIVPNSELFTMPAQTIKGNLAGAPAQPTDVPLSTLIAALGFGSFSLTPNGYYIFPNGLILQWGVYTYTTPASISVTFPVAFTISCLLFNPGIHQTGMSSNQNNVTLAGESATTTHWSATSDENGDNSPMRLNWIALGY
jgi:hypothetical protein